MAWSRGDVIFAGHLIHVVRTEIDVDESCIIARLDKAAQHLGYSSLDHEMLSGVREYLKHSKEIPGLENL